MTRHNHPVFLHLYCSAAEAHDAMRKACQWLKFHKGFVVSVPARLVRTDDIDHLFKTPEWLSGYPLNGLRFVGFDTCSMVRLSDNQAEYLRSRTRE